MELKQTFPIGMGTWGVGGYFEENPALDKSIEISGLSYGINKGINYLETVNQYANGTSLKLLSQAVLSSNKKRSQLYLTLSIYPEDVNSVSDLKFNLDNFLSKFKTHHIDNLQFSMETIVKLGLKNIESFAKDMTEKGKIKGVGIVNANLETLKMFHKVFDKLVLTHEICHNFEIRENYKMGIIQYARENNILNISYQPLRRNKTAKRNWPLLVEMSKKYNATQNQIILNWLIRNGIKPIVKSTNPIHINENLNSINLNISKIDIEELDNFSLPGYLTPEINWTGKNKGVKMAQLPDLFDNFYPKN
jgi:diketogulonate reductase-like aldo/keto reductase